MRYFDQFTKVLSKEGIHHYLDNSRYVAQFKVAEEIFKDNIFFGVGIKNFRVESFSDKYDNIGHIHLIEEQILILIKYIMNFCLKLGYLVI